MRAFIASLAAIVVIAAASGVVLQAVEPGTSMKFQSDNVRQ